MEKDFTKQKEAFAELLDIMETLREKCPWDHKQTMESLRTLSVEEVYELGDAILKNDMQEVKKELGICYAYRVLCLDREGTGTI